ncbi:MAG: NAD(P)/FAD-dependent oxidoreductase [Acidimicrobiales bacterium]
METAYDVVVVGARCAGSPLATQLARAGLSVAVVDRAEFPSDTASTHIFQVEGVASLSRLGVLDTVLATGAPWLERVDVRVESFRAHATVPLRPGDAGPGLCVRRRVLDAILVDAARAAGADVRTATRVVGLLGGEGDRVRGVRVVTGGREEDLLAALVVGADGAGSTVARLVGSRRYNVVPNQRFGTWRYYQGARWESPATLVFHRWAGELVIACPADGGLYLVIVIPPLARLGAFRSDVAAGWAAAVAGCEPVADAIAGARAAGRDRTMSTYPAFFRESAGPGWVLVGDAGHVTDPTPGQGISDALRQVDRLAPAVVAGLGGQHPLDRALADWWRWRDADAAEMHWFAADLGAAASSPAVVVELMQRLTAARGGTARLVDVLNHRMAPSGVMTPRRLVGAGAGLMLDRRQPVRAVAADMWALVGQDLRRRRLNRHPDWEPAQPPLRTGERGKVSLP